MERLRLYRVNIDYIKYLYSYDNRVQYTPDKPDNYTQRRPYLGIVLKVENYDYFVPLEHPRKQHRKKIKNLLTKQTNDCRIITNKNLYEWRPL